MPLSVRVHDALDAVDAAAWAEIGSHRSAFQERAWYLRAAPPGVPRLVVAERGGRPAAVLPVFLLDESSHDRHYYHSPRELLCGFRERALMEATGRPLESLERAANLPWYPAAVAVSPYGYRGGVIASPGDEEAARAVAAAAEDVCRGHGARLLAHYYLNEDDDRAWLQVLSARGATPVVLGADCNLDVTWSSLDGYFRWLGRSRRAQRQEHRRARGDAAIEWIALDSADGDFPEPIVRRAVSLFAGTAERHHHALPPLRFYEGLLRDWPGRRWLLAAASGGHLRSALLVLAHAGTLYPKLFGADERDDYFHLGFSWLIERAIAAGYRRIEYGGGSHRTKLLRGAKLRWLHGSLQVFDRDLGLALASLLPEYVAAKTRHFEELARSSQIDHVAPPLAFGEGC